VPDDIDRRDRLGLDDRRDEVGLEVVAELARPWPRFGPPGADEIGCDDPMPILQKGRDALPLRARTAARVQREERAPLAP
jgi:hypothetical protein